MPRFIKSFHDFIGGPMPTIMKISSQGQIRIPKKFMQALGIETGDYLEVDTKQDQIVLKPRKLIDPTQGWYWTKEWQEKEKEAESDIAEDSVSKEFKTAEEGLEWLK
jgi:AbrB family looped-hinge helix DNA binding protein